VAINYAVGKKFPKKEYHMFYDMGAGSTVATLTSFYSGPEKKSSLQSQVDIEVIGFAVSKFYFILDPTLGGKQVDFRIQGHLAEIADEGAKGSKKFKSDIADNPRAMARLLKEANRCKTILSANQHVGSSIESLLEGYDFKTVVKRETLEELCKDLFAETTKPIELVLQNSNMTMDDIKSLVLFGGGVRVPAVQKLLSDFAGDSKIARNVDGDEAAVFGAVLHAAAVSAQFKLGQTTRIKDLNSRPITVSYDTEKDGTVISLDLGARSDMNVFTEKSLLGSKKVITFKRLSDFIFDLDYSTINTDTKSSIVGVDTWRDVKPVPIAKVKVSGIPEAIEKYKGKYSAEPSVKVNIQLTESGLLVIKDASIQFEVIQVADKEKEKEKDSSWSFFGGGSKEEKKEKGDEKKGGDNDDEKEASSTTTTSAKATKTPAADKKVRSSLFQDKNKPVVKTDTAGNKVIVEKVSLKLDIIWQTIAPLSAEAKQKMKAR
jgi:hypoxia up-regulated 1